MAAKESAEHRGEIRLVDEHGTQRFLGSTTKPRSIVDGEEYERVGEDGTYLVFNDENGSEKGGIIATSNSALVSLDYANTDAIHLATAWRGNRGGAELTMHHLSDPELRVDEVGPTPLGARLHCTTQRGSGLELCDSQGRPRIVLRVDPDDVPSICILDENGDVVSRLG